MCLQSPLRHRIEQVTCPRAIRRDSRAGSGRTSGAAFFGSERCRAISRPRLADDEIPEVRASKAWLIKARSRVMSKSSIPWGLLRR